MSTSLNDQPMPITSHLKELRNRLIIVLVVFAAGILVCLHYSGDIVRLLTDMGTRYGYRFVYIAPQELLMVYFNIAFIGGLVITSPVLLYEGYMFAKPALTVQESKAVKRTLFFGFLCFMIGILFAYRISLPFMLYFLISFSDVSVVSASISIQEFISFLLTVFIIFGVIFEMPVVTALLSALGILKPNVLKKIQKPVIVVIFIIAAVITPPDVVSQIMVAIPMLVLYQLSMSICQLIDRKKAINDKEE